MTGRGKESLPLAQAVECRMVLPGIQALFGFQSMAVFGSGFAVVLSPAEQKLHVLAIAPVAVAVALVMTRTACHRQVGLQEISEGFMRSPRGGGWFCAVWFLLPRWRGKG